MRSYFPKAKLHANETLRRIPRIASCPARNGVYIAESILFMV